MSHASAMGHVSTVCRIIEEQKGGSHNSTFLALFHEQERRREWSKRADRNDKELDIESEAWVISEELLKACQTKLRYHLVAAGVVNNQGGGNSGGASNHADSALAKTSSVLDAALKEQQQRRL